MAIETVQREAGQTKLIEETKEEREKRYCQMDFEMADLEERRRQLLNMANAVKNEIKAKEKDKKDLREKLKAGQGVFIPVAVSDSAEAPEGMEMDIPSDEELEEFADDLKDEQDEETTSGEDMEGGDAEPGEADTDSSSEGDTENNDENMPKNIPNEAPADIQLAEPDHWRLFDFETLTLLDKVKNKKEPVIGQIYGLPSTLWQKNGKTHYQVQGASVIEEDDEAFWETYVTLMSDEEKAALEAENSEEAV